MESVNILTANVKNFIPFTGLQQFWLEKSSNESVNLGICGIM